MGMTGDTQRQTDSVGGYRHIEIDRGKEGLLLPAPPQHKHEYRKMNAVAHLRYDAPLQQLHHGVL
eukprot:22324-Eustigmatos_ZCMA.PRE.1